MRLDLLLRVLWVQGLVDLRVFAVGLLDTRLAEQERVRGFVVVKVAARVFNCIKVFLVRVNYLFAFLTRFDGGVKCEVVILSVIRILILGVGPNKLALGPGFFV